MTPAPAPSSRIRPRTLGAALALFAGVLAPSSLDAAIVFWDADATVNGSYGGDGVWNTSTANWATASDGTGTLQTWTSGDTANFGGSSGDVDVSSGVSAASLVFRAGTYDYTLTGSAITFTTADFGNLISNNSGVTANISIENDLNLVDANGAGNNTYNFSGQASARYTLSGDFNITGATGGINTISFNLSNATSSYHYSGSTNADSRVAFRIGTNGTSGGARVTLSGSNAPVAATVINRGVLILGHDLAAGTQDITLANATAGGADTAMLLATAGRTIANAITVVDNSADTNTTDVRRIGGEFISGTATFSGAIVVHAQKQANGLELAAAGNGAVIFSNTISGAGRISKVDGGAVRLTKAEGNTYSGGTAVLAGTLSVANTSGSGTGSGAVSVATGATLGGLHTGLSDGGIIAGPAAFSAGSFLAPGSNSGTANTLAFGSTVDLSAVTSGSGGLLFQLGAIGDKVVLTSGALNIGTLDFEDFDFTLLAGFGAGVYTLFDTSTTIVGTLGNTSGTIGGLEATLSLANSGQDIVLTVGAIPEPTTYATLFGALALGFAASRRAVRGALRSDVR